MNTKALVTLVIGDKYRQDWEKSFRRCVELYAQKYSYDVIAIDHYLDPGPLGSARPPHWQKLLILEHPEVRQYEQVVWIDADILLNHHHAPCIATAAGNSDKIGLVPYSLSEMGTPRKADNRFHRKLFAVPAPRISQWYSHYGLADPSAPDVDDFTNTGVLVLRPRAHAPFFRWIYDNCKEIPGAHQENGPLSYHIFRLGLANPIDERFNVSWNGEMMEHYPFLASKKNFENRALVSLCVNAAWNNSYFLHFVGATGRTCADLVFTHRSSANALEVVATA
jgi:hypothetical protein